MVQTELGSRYERLAHSLTYTVAVGQGSSNRQTKLGQSPKKDGSSIQAQTYAPLSFRHWSPSYKISALRDKSCVQAV